MAWCMDELTVSLSHVFPELIDTEDIPGFLVTAILGIELECLCSTSHWGL